MAELGAIPAAGDAPNFPDTGSTGEAGSAGEVGRAPAGFAGSDALEGIHTLRTLDDALRIRRRALESRTGVRGRNGGSQGGRGPHPSGPLRDRGRRVYAAGDIAETFDPSLGERRVNARWPLAIEQGEVAGANMAGDRRRYLGGMPMNSFHWDGISVITLGASVPRGPEYHTLSRTSSKRGTVRQLVFRGSRLAGAALIGDVEGSAP